LSTETILDLVERFGLVDMVTSKVRQRLEEVDLDDLFDELQRYVRRNPEVLVVALATITVSAGLIVYLNARNEEAGYGGADEEEEVPVRVRAAAPRARR
jgi:excinuclease UvrABC helicase subunit UvrB